MSGLIAQRRGGGIGRRQFLAAMAAILAGAGRGAPGGEPRTPLAGKSLETLAAVQEHLLPGETDAPGAAQVNALAYLQAVLLDPLVEDSEKRFLVNGVGSLAEYTARTFGAEFAELDADARETVLRTVERGPAGRDWIALVLYYLFEALLTDPVYGGNPDGVGWQWLAHQPGFPRPSSGKRHFEL